MTSVGHKGDPENHPVCKAIIDFVGAGKKGTETRKHFVAAPTKLVRVSLRENLMNKLKARLKT